jgi:hypothetical protein
MEPVRRDVNLKVLPLNFQGVLFKFDAAIMQVNAQSVPALRRFAVVYGGSQTGRHYQQLLRGQYGIS